MRFVCSAMLALVICCPARADQLNLDGGWRLWCDTKAEWKDDDVFLPGEFAVSKLPVNPPTIGWDALYKSGIPVKLPSTVEEHFWGKLSKRDYTDNEYYFGNDDKQVKNGGYLGVSWWWTTLKCPKEIEGKLAFLKFDGARLRAEVFLNEQLVGYDIIGETPFSLDVTGKLKPGAENTLAVRITNPGGRLDWMDGDTFRWGKNQVPVSHAFGGINKGVRVEFRPKVYVGSVFVMNRADPGHITVRAEIVNSTASAASARLQAVVKESGAAQWTTISVPPGKSTVSLEMRMSGARPWSVDDPRLYTCRTTLASGGQTDTVDTRFGFRYMEAKGIGSDAALYWNDKRIVLRSAISWGFWGINGLWPDETMAKREIENAKKIGLNCLNSHRTIAKPILLDLQDRMGLLRYEEPGSGCCITSESDFARRYMREKIARMVERDRNHPCLAMYCIQNEWNDVDPNDPRVEQVLRMVHELDPSRPVIVKSGDGLANQAFLLPYDDTLRKDDGTGYSGWCDKHTVGGPGMYKDELYKGPQEWSHRSDNLKEIMFWGEMLGCGTPDNLQPVCEFYEETCRTGYDHDDNAEQYTAFDQFLDRRGFRKAFPTVADLTRSIGNKSYYFWGRLLENARISDPNDAAVVSGWESTSIENHSGIVDSHRYMKGDPSLISWYCRPLHLAVKSRRVTIETGDTLVTDLHIVNEVGVSGEGELRFTVAGPDGAVLEKRSLPVKVTGGEVFGELLAAGVETKRYSKPGYYTLKATLVQKGKTVVEGRERIYVVDNTPPVTQVRGAIRDYYGGVKRYLADKGIRLPDYSKDLGKLDYIITAGDDGAGIVGGTQRMDQPIAGTEDDPLYQKQIEMGTDDGMVSIVDIPNGPYRLIMKFAELVHHSAGERVFDLAVNGETVLRDFDVLKEAGGKFRALDKVIDVDITGHKLSIRTPRITAGRAVLNAVLIEGPEIKIGINCQGGRYMDKSGFEWTGRVASPPIPEDILRRVHDDGTRLIYWSSGPDMAHDTIRFLAEQGVLKYEGRVGGGVMSWMGCWTAAREHPLLAGLPVNTAMNWEYQADTGRADGYMVDAPGIEWVTAYGRHHDRNVGTSLFTVPFGKGEIIFNAVHGPYDAVTREETTLATPVARHMLLNAVKYCSVGR